MGLETSTTISGLNALWPLGSDPKSEGDNHLRLIKAVLQAVFSDTEDADEITLVEPRVRFTRASGPPETVTIDFLDADMTTVIAGFTLGEDGLVVDTMTLTGLMSDLVLFDADEVERGRIAATKTAGQGGLTLTAKDQLADQKSKLVIGSSFLDYSPDDATKIFRINPTNQLTGTTAVMRVPATALESVPGIWEPIYSDVYANAAPREYKNLDAYEFLRFSFHAIAPANCSYGLQASADNGATWLQTANSYGYGGISAGGAGAVANNLLTGNAAYLALGATVLANGSLFVPTFEICNWNKPSQSIGCGQHMFARATDSLLVNVAGVCTFPTSLVFNALRIVASGNFSGHFVLEGIRG